MKALWKALSGDSAAVVLVVVIIAYTYLKINGIDERGFFAVLAGMLVAKMVWGTAR